MTNEQYEAMRAAITAAEASGPVEGMPCTYNIGSDHYACSIAYVSPSKAFCTVVLHGKSERFSRCQDGRYRGKGRCGSLTLGHAETRLDPGF